MALSIHLFIKKKKEFRISPGEQIGVGKRKRERGGARLGGTRKPGSFCHPTIDPLTMSSIIMK